jgi:hypothetical protein
VDVARARSLEPIREARDLEPLAEIAIEIHGVNGPNGLRLKGSGHHQHRE